MPRIKTRKKSVTTKDAKDPARPSAGTKTGILNCDLFSFSVRNFVSLVLFVAQISGGKNGSHKGHEEHKGKTHSRLTI
jgi:hypothetical protein